jgi:site-specific recombinase XerD
MHKPNFADFIYSYFAKHLPLQRGLSDNTICSYSHSLKIFILYCRNERNISCDNLTLEKIDKHLVLDFLLWLEAERGNSVATRNQRLSSLKSLFQYIQSESVVYTALYRDIVSIREKKTPVMPPKYLSEEELGTLFSMPNINEKHGRRDFVLLLLLYDSAARAAELTALKFGDIVFGKTPTVKLFGKRSKTRIVPITSKTADMLQGYLREFRIVEASQLVFTNHSHNMLTTTGISYIIKKYAEMGKQHNPEMFRMPISPHLLRSTKASHLIQSGVNIYYIRDFLGHSSVTTTERYTRNNPEVVRKAINKASSDLVAEVDYYDTTEKSSLLDFLNSIR